MDGWIMDGGKESGTEDDIILVVVMCSYKPHLHTTYQGHYITSWQ